LVIESPATPSFDLSFLYFDHTDTLQVDPEVAVEEELNEEEEIDPTSRCAIVRKSSYLQARRTLETSDPASWDLAAIGLYQREAETEVVKKLKHIILQFDT
jgi:hypothetical protein